MAVVHNKFLLVRAETGILGLITFWIVLLSIIYQGWICLRSNPRDPILAIIGLSFACGIFGQIFHMLYNIFRSSLTIQILWFIGGMATALAQMSVAESREAASESATTSVGLDDQRHGSLQQRITSA